MKSQRIGSDHEDLMAGLLESFGVSFIRQKPVTTLHGAIHKLDFWLPPNKQRPSVILECKTFGVQAKNPRDSQRRKVQEALWLLIQLKRYCPETKGARLILVTGEMPFLETQIALLQDELAPEFHILSIKDTAHLKALID